mgnify:CR=1 FL=1
MAWNPNEHDLVLRERRADAERDAARWRLVKAMRKEKGTAAWLVRLRLSRPSRRRVHIERKAPASQARPSVSQSKL